MKLTPEQALGRPIAEVVKAYAAGTLDPRDVCDAAIAKARAVDPMLRAYRVITEDLARRQAADAARAIAEDARAVGPLCGIPVAIKDAFHVAGYVTTVGSVWLRHDRRGADSGAVQRLRDAGAVFIGKTNTPEFCQSSSTENLLDLDTANPWDLARTPGGSSGGSAAALASKSCLLALGSDGGGSIRIPASFSGLVGLKPTNGRCLDEGGVSVFSDFATAGPMAWRVSDTRRMFGVLSGAVAERAAVPPLRIGLCRRPEQRPVDPLVLANFDRAAALLEPLGHTLIDIDLAVQDWYKAFGPLLVSDEYHQRGHLLGHPDVLTSYELATLRTGQRTTTAQVEQASQTRQRVREVVQRAFDGVDVILTPTTAVPAFVLGERPEEIAGEPVSRLWGATPFTAVFNLTGNPAVALPSGLAHGLPTSVQLVGPHGADELLLDLAEDLERVLALDLINAVPDLARRAA